MPHLSDDEAPKEAGIPTIISFCEDICDTGYDTIFSATLGNKDSKQVLTEANKVPLFTKKSATLCTPAVEDGTF